MIGVYMYFCTIIAGFTNDSNESVYVVVVKKL